MLSLDHAFARAETFEGPRASTLEALAQIEFIRGGLLLRVKRRQLDRCEFDRALLLSVAVSHLKRIFALRLLRLYRFYPRGV